MSKKSRRILTALGLGLTVVLQSVGNVSPVSATPSYENQCPTGATKVVGSMDYFSSSAHFGLDGSAAPYTLPAPSNSVVQLPNDTGCGSVVDVYGEPQSGGNYYDAYFAFPALPAGVTYIQNNSITIDTSGTPGEWGWFYSFFDAQGLTRSMSSPNTFQWDALTLSTPSTLPSSGEFSFSYTLDRLTTAQKANFDAGHLIVGAGGMGGTGNQASITAFDELKTMTIRRYGHIVSYDSNGGTGTMDRTGGQAAAALPSSTFQRTGYTFSGWNTSADGTGTAYADLASFPYAADTTLYAQWTSDAPAGGNGGSTGGSGQGTSGGSNNGGGTTSNNSSGNLAATGGDFSLTVLIALGALTSGSVLFVRRRKVRVSTIQAKHRA